MADRDRSTEPWNDAPADSEAPSDAEPEPAEVEGDEGEESDVAASPVPDPYDKYTPETLDQRLTEEEPEGSPRAAPDDSIAFSDEDDEPGAEEAAMHVTDRP